MILKFLKIFKQKKLFFAAVLTMAAAGLFFPSGNAQAGLLESVGGFVMDIIAPIIYLVFYIFFYIAYVVAWIGASVINMTLNPAIINSVLNIDPKMPLYQSWAIFRDIANLFFILILLFIAIGTIVRSQSYNLKNLLPKLIIAVFLINFSNVITSVIIDFGNIFMYGVLKWMCPPAASATCFQDFYAQLMGVIDALFWKYPITAISFDFKDAASIGIAAIYTFIYGLVLIALGIFLVIRIAVLALLIILSPLAFVGEVFPGLKEISSEWWDKLIKYAMFGPIFALLLYVSGLMAQNTIAVDPAVFESNPNLSWMAQNITLILTNIIPLIFLLAIIPVTQKLGIAGANAVFSSVGGLAKSVGASAFGHVDRFMARGAGKTGTGVYAKLRRGLSTVSYGAYKRGKKAHDADREKDYDIATGAARNRIEKATFGDTKTDYEKRARDAKAEAEIKLRGTLDTQEIIDEAQNALEKGINPEIHVKDLKSIAAGDGMDDFLDREIDKRASAAAGHDVFYGRGAAGLRKYLDDTFGEGGTGYKNLDENAISKLADNIHNSEKKNGNVGYAGISTTRYDAAARRTVHEVNDMATPADITAQEDEQVKAGNKMDPKDLKKSSFLDKNNEISNAGERILSDMKGRRADRIKTMDRDRVVEIDRALTNKYQAVALPGQSPILACQAANPELATAWGELKTQHNL